MGSCRRSHYQGVHCICRGSFHFRLSSARERIFSLLRVFQKDGEKKKEPSLFFSRFNPYLLLLALHYISKLFDWQLTYNSWFARWLLPIKLHVVNKQGHDYEIETFPPKETSLLFSLQYIVQQIIFSYHLTLIER